MAKAQIEMNENNKILITGGAGFIGSAVVRWLINNSEHSVIVLDKLTYSGNLSALKAVENSPRYHFVQADICNLDALKTIFSKHKPDKILHLAAESHVDRSISDSSDFISTNIIGTHNLLEASLEHWRTSASTYDDFIFHHVSTDEVFGDLGETEGQFSELTPYAPNSPYSASKAASDHLVRAWHKTYGLPTIVSNCSNNYGPYQHPEKLIPMVISNAIMGKNIPVYGNGLQIRDWLYVDDHVAALMCILFAGEVGQTYNIGGDADRTNLEVIETICNALQELRPSRVYGISSYESLITYVTDRPGHDFRYSVNSSKIREKLGWEPIENFITGIQKTVSWHLKNENWLP